MGELNSHNYLDLIGNCFYEYDYNKNSLVLILIRLLISFLILLICLISNIPTDLNIILLLLAYLICGFDILFSSIKGLVKGRLFNESLIISAATLCAFIVGSYFEAASGMLLFNLGLLLRILITKRFKKQTKFYSNATNLKDFIGNTPFDKSTNEIWVTRFSKIYMLVVIAGAVLIALLPYIIGRPEDFSLFIERSVILLAVSYPASLLYSVKSSYSSGIIAAFENGIIIKGTKHLDTFNNVGAAAFDYLSTITTGKLVLKDIILKNGYSKEEVLYFAAALESLEKGRISSTVLSAYSGKIATAVNINKIPSLGIIADVDGKKVSVGDIRLMQKFSIEVPDIKSGGILIYVAVNGIFAGILSIKDEIKRASADAIYALNDMGIKTAILTGENIFSANEIAEQTRVREIYSGIFPEQKAGVLESILKQRDTFGKIAYASGNADDLKALKRADIGIYIGELKGAAFDSADAVIPDSDLKKIKTAVNIANKTINIVWQNIFISLFFKALVTILGVLGLIPLFTAILLDSIIIVFTMLISFMASKFN